MERNQILRSEIHNVRSFGGQYNLCYLLEYSISQDIVHKQFKEEVATTDRWDTNVSGDLAVLLRK